MEVLENIKFKELTEDLRAPYIRRLLRFGYPPDIRQRIYFRILNEFSISPNVSKKIFNNMKAAEIDYWVSKIWNEKLYFSPSNEQFVEEIRCFSSKKMIEDILNISLTTEFSSDILKKEFEYAGYDYWHGIKNYDEAYLCLRGQYPLILPQKEAFAVQKIILTEGETEAILLPAFAKVLGFDFEKNGIFLVAAGGKNQVVKDYLKYRDILNLPIITILDNDAKEQYDSIFSILREQDKILLLKDGEFEDLLPQELVLDVLSYNFANIASFDKEDLIEDFAMTHNLHEVFRKKGLGDFKKVEFAKMIFEYIKNTKNLGKKIENLIDFLR